MKGNTVVQSIPIKIAFQWDDDDNNGNNTEDIF